LEGEELTDEDIHGSSKSGVSSRAFVPVLCGSAIKGIGIDLLMDFVNNCMPSPLEISPKSGTNPADNSEVMRAPDPDALFSGFVFKTIADPYAGRLSIFKIVSGTLGSEGNFYNASKETKERFNQLLTVAGKEQKVISEAGPGAIVAVAKLKETTTGDIFSSLSKLLEEDLALKLDRIAETKEILLSGCGHVHIEATVEKLKRKFNVAVNLHTPKVPYKETIKKKVRVQGKHKKQSGGHGQYGDCWIDLEPLPRGGGFEFVDAVVGGVIPRQYIPAVEKGIIEAAPKGVIAGFPCIDFRVTLNDGSFHAVDSSEMAFKIAGSLAFKKGVEAANPVLLEPIMKVTITTPDEYMGDIMGDLNGRRGRVLGMDSAGKNQVINAQVPMSEFLTYAPDLRSMTGGRGMFTMEFSHYDEVPVQMAEKIIEDLKQE
ncbi:MAG: elongation factor G, partial [Deltaproteobacteria bacterium]|nr:elongation factor G [Deltaproteobacteria bacterium]